jgi:serine/threonine protein kinase
MIAFLCSNCGAQLRVRDELAGTTGKCPRCKQSLEAPRPSSVGLAVAPRQQSERAPAAGPTQEPSAPSSETAGGPLPLPGPASWHLDVDGEVEPPREVFESAAGVATEELTFLSPAEQPDELGRLGNYRILRILGAGAMGIVFQAEDVHLKRPVALKAMRSSMASKEADRKRFLREAQTVAALDHEHIVPIYQVGEDRGVPFLAMKLLQGESLEDRLSRCGGRLELAEALRIGQEMAEGLAAAHGAGLIHRDIKPANIWLEAGKDWVRIVDFGLARPADEDVHLTQPGAIMGTPAYMAPEQAAAAALDQRCDLFSLGCVLYRMSTGKLPFKGKNMIAVLTALATRVPKPPAVLDPSLPPAFSDLVMRLLSKKPEGRPRSAGVVVSALAAIRRELEEGPPEPEPELLEVEEEEAAEVEEVEEVEEVKEHEEAAAEDEEDDRREGPRRSRRGTGRRKKGRQDDLPPEDYWERRVMKLAIATGIAIFLLIVFLIARHIWKTSHPDPNDAASPPAQTIVVSYEL